MNTFTTFKLALRALWRNKVRTLLTMAGIVFGIGAVIAMVSGGQGAHRELEGGEDAHAATSALRGVWLLSSMMRPSRRVTTREA